MLGRKAGAAALALSAAVTGSPPVGAGEEEQALWAQHANACSDAQAAGQYAQAEPACTAAVALAERLEPALFLDTSLNSLILVRLGQRRHAEAEALISRLIQVRQVSLGPEHPMTVGGMHMLSALYRKLGRMEEAVLLEGRMAAILEKCESSLPEDIKDQIARGAIPNPCNPVALPEMLR